MATDMSEKGLEALISNSLTTNGWLPSEPPEYKHTQHIDLSRLSAFLTATKPETAAALPLNTDTPKEGSTLSRQL